MTTSTTIAPSSCAINTTEIRTGRTFLQERTTTIATNSCTGETVQFYTWEPTAEARLIFFISVVVVVFAFALIIGAVSLLFKDEIN